MFSCEFWENFEKQLLQDTSGTCFYNFQNTFRWQPHFSSVETMDIFIIMKTIIQFIIRDTKLAVNMEIKPSEPNNSHVAKKTLNFFFTKP